MNGRLTITDISKALGITTRTIMRWEKAGRIKRAKRDWRGWRFYLKEDLEEIKRFYESAYDYEALEGQASGVAKNALIILLALTCLFSTYILCAPAYSDAKPAQIPGVQETEKSVDIILDELPAVNSPEDAITESVKYTLGPNDVISVEVRRHPEFSGEYKVNSEGKIEYKYVGDILVTGLTKLELNERLGEVLSEYIIDPEVDVQIAEYLSKVFYVVGDVNRPGKFYMKGDSITVRESLIHAGLPNHAAAMRRCRIITPDECGKNNYVTVNVYKLLYEGDLRENLVMKPGDVLYIPATIMAKAIRVISPVTNVISGTAETASSAAAAVAL